VAITDDELQEFLSGSHIGVLAVERHGRAPLAMPIWYAYEPGGPLRIWTGRDSLKARLISAAGRFSLVAQDETPPYRWARAEGAVESLDRATKDDVRSIALRYVSAEEAERYAVELLGENDVIITMRPERVTGSTG